MWQDEHRLCIFSCSSEESECLAFDRKDSPDVPYIGAIDDPFCQDLKWSMRDMCTNGTPLARTRPNRTGEPGFIDLLSVNQYKNSFILSTHSVPNPPCPLQLTISVLSRPLRPQQPPQLLQATSVPTISSPAHLLQLLFVDACPRAVSKVLSTFLFFYEKWFNGFFRHRP